MAAVMEARLVKTAPSIVPLAALLLVPKIPTVMTATSVPTMFVIAAFAPIPKTRPRVTMVSIVTVATPARTAVVQYTAVAPAVVAKTASSLPTLARPITAVVSISAPQELREIPLENQMTTMVMLQNAMTVPTTPEMSASCGLRMYPVSMN
jgi:hypothetical protein